MNDGIELDHVRDVLSRHRETLMALPGVTGTGIGASADGVGYVIVVYQQERSDALPGPEEFEGVAVQYTLTGAFRSQDQSTKPKELTSRRKDHE